MSSHPSERFAANLRRLRDEADLSQEELAFRAAIHRTQVSLLEGGRRMPRVETLVKLAGSLGATPNDLLDGSTGSRSRPSPAAWSSRLRKAARMPERERALAVAERFGQNLRRVRKREDLSQEQLARRASLHRTEIGKLENTERVCRIDTLIRLAGAMAVEPAELLDGIHWVPGPEPEGAFAFGASSITRIPSPATDESGG